MNKLNKNSDEKTQKIKISISISKYLKNKIDELVKTGEFSSVSELISIAVTRFLVEYEKEKEKKDSKLIFKEDIEIR